MHQQTGSNLKTSDANRRNDLARIHLAAHEVGLDDEAYRDLLRSTTGKSSAGEMNARERMQVLMALIQLGAKSTGTRPPTSSLEPDKARAMAKVKAMLEAQCKPLGYGDGMARKMFNRVGLDACDSAQLRRIVAALNYHAKRHQEKG